MAAASSAASAHLPQPIPPPYNPYSPSPQPPPSSHLLGQDQPITRSRTLFFLSVRDSSTFASSSSHLAGPGSSSRHRYSQDDRYSDTYADGNGDDQGESSRLMKNPSVAVDMRGLPPRWVDISDEVEDLLNRAKAKISALDKLHAKHVLPGFTDRSSEEREIERQTTDITKDFRRCTTLISSIQPSQGAPQVERLTTKNVQRGLAQKVQDLSGQFRKKQRVYMQKLQGHAIKNKDLLAASGAISLRGSELDELADDEMASKTQLQSQQAFAVDVDIAQRGKEITQIATSIAELADLFRDLGALVVEQGTVLDSVEYNVQQTATAMQGAVEELEVAKRYQSNRGRRMCMLLLILIIVGLVIVLIYKPRRHSLPSGGTGSGTIAGASSTSILGGGVTHVAAAVGSSLHGHLRPIRPGSR